MPYCKQYIGKRAEVVKTSLMDAMTECRYRAPSLILLDDLDTLCHIPQDIANTAEENYLTSLASIFCRVLLSGDSHGETQCFIVGISCRQPDISIFITSILPQRQ